MTGVPEAGGTATSGPSTHQGRDLGVTCLLVDGKVEDFS